MELFSATKERTRSYFLGSFILSFLVYNWDLIFFIVLEDRSYIEAYVKEKFRGDLTPPYTLYFQNVIYPKITYILPIISAIVVSLSGPFVDYGIRFFRAKPIKWSRAIDKQIMNPNLISLTEKERLQDELELYKSGFKRKLDLLKLEKKERYKLSDLFYESQRWLCISNENGKIRIEVLEFRPKADSFTKTCFVYPFSVPLDIYRGIYATNPDERNYIGTLIDKTDNVIDDKIKIYKCELTNIDNEKEGKHDRFILDFERESTNVRTKASYELLIINKYFYKSIDNRMKLFNIDILVNNPDPFSYLFEQILNVDFHNSPKKELSHMWWYKFIPAYLYSRKDSNETQNSGVNLVANNPPHSSSRS